MAISDKTIAKLLQGELRIKWRDNKNKAAARIYDGKYVPSACGRMLIRIGSAGDKGVLLTKGGAVITTEPDVAEKFRAIGYFVSEVESFDRQKMKEQEKQLAAKENMTAAEMKKLGAIQWMLGR